jgi:hypothetical protein
MLALQLTDHESKIMKHVAILMDYRSQNLEKPCPKCCGKYTKYINQEVSCERGHGFSSFNLPETKEFSKKL